MVNDRPLQVGTLRHAGNAQGLARIVGQRVQDRGVEVVAFTRHTIERFAAIIEGLIGRSFLHQVFAHLARRVADTIDQRPFDTALANFQTHSPRPTRQLRQCVQGQALTVCRHRVWQVQPGESLAQPALLGVPTALFQQTQRRVSVGQSHQFFGVGLAQHGDGARLAEPGT
ncbi:hypothetical protein D3C73_724350 [compost metagenome]